MSSRLISQIEELLKAGFTKTEAGASLGLSRHQVRRLLQKTPASADSGTAIKWGYGAAKLVAPSTKEATELVVFGSDFHFPYHDPAAVQSFLNLVARLQPHRVVLNGDINDFFQLSRFNLSGEREDDLQDEIDQGNNFRANVRAAAPNAVIDECEGNHCSRITTYTHRNSRALKSLRCLTREEQFKFWEFKINGHPGAGFLLRPHFLVKHGSFVRKDAGASAKAEFMAAGISGISGHTHRLAPYKVAGYTQRVWWEQGCFCRLDPDYVVGRPNWEQGGMIGEFSTKSDNFVMHPVPFLDGRLRWGKDSF